MPALTTKRITTNNIIPTRDISYNYCTNQGIALGNYTTTSGWDNVISTAVALSVDTFNTKNSDHKALKLTSLTTAECAVETTIAQKVVGTTKEIRVFLYLHNAPSKYTSIYIYLPVVAWTKFMYFNVTSLTLVQGWNYLRLTSSLGWVSYGGATWDDTFVKIRWRVKSADAGELGAITIDSAINGRTYEPKVIFTFDNGYDNNYTKAFPAMSAYGYSGTIFVNPSKIDVDANSLTLEHCNTLYNAGWDISNNGYTPLEYNTSTADEIEADISDAKTWLLNNGFSKSALFFGVPNGEDNANVQTSLINNGYLTSRNNVDGTFFADEVSLLALMSKTIKNTNDVTSVMTIVNSAIASGKTCVLRFNQILDDDSGTEYSWSVVKLTDLCTALQNTGVSVVPMSTWYNGLNICRQDITEYANISLSLKISAKETSGRDAKISSDGTKVYVTGSASNQVHQYNLGTAYKIDTGVFAASYNVAVELIGSVYGFFFKPDGSKLYVVGSNNDTVFQYSLSTAWDISKTSYDTKSFSVAVETGSPRKVLLSNDGAYMYILATDKTMFQYTLGTAWDISTAVVLQHVHLALGGVEGCCIFFSTDGKKLYAGGADSIIHQYNLSTPWDLSTASYASKYKDVSTLDSVIWGICFSHDMLHMYVIGSGNDKVYGLKSGG